MLNRVARTIGDPIQQFFNAVIVEDFSKIEALIKAEVVSIKSTAPNGGKQALHVAVVIFPTH